MGGGEKYYHVMSRIVDRRMLLGEREKRVFVGMMEAFGRFSGCEVLTYCVMDNHFHILLKVSWRSEDEKKAISEEEIWERMGHIYSEARMAKFRVTVERYTEQGRGIERVEFFDGMRKRMYDLSMFVKDLKQKFTHWYNLENERKGTMWEERFKSVVISPRDRSLSAMAAYIDMNPVRAGIVDSPEAYTWSGYSAAASGYEVARKGLAEVMVYSRSKSGGTPDWVKLDGMYREMMGVNIGGEAGNPENRERHRKTLEEGGLLKLGELIQCRVVSFTTGLVFGGREFVEQMAGELFASHGGGRYDHAGIEFETSDGVALSFLRRSRRAPEGGERDPGIPMRF